MHLLVSLVVADSTRFRLLYDARMTLPGTAVLLIPLVGVALAGLWKFRESGGFEGLAETSARDGIMAVGAMAIGAFGTLMIVVTVILPHYNLRHALNTGGAIVREGVVMHYRPGGAGGHGDEAWWLKTATDSVEYRYSPSTLAPGFSQVGLLGNGVYIRLSDVSGQIAKLEVAQ